MHSNGGGRRANGTSLHIGRVVENKKGYAKTYPFKTDYHPQALTPIAPATAEATAMMILRITSQVDFFMTLIF